MYHFEDLFTLFLEERNNSNEEITLCYEYINLIYDKIIETFMKELEKVELNEEYITVMMFSWSVRIKEEENDDKSFHNILNSFLKNKLLRELLKRKVRKRKK